MLYIVLTRDCSLGGEGDVISKFSDDQWAEAQAELAYLKRRYGNVVKLMDH